MISAEIILDDRRKSKKGYPIKIRIYDSLEKKETPYKYIPLKIYQPGPDINYCAQLKRRSLDLENEIEFCNNNLLKLNDAFDIISNGIPHDDIEIEIAMLKKRLELLESKQKKKSEKMFIEFVDELINERTIKKLNIKAYLAIKGVVQTYIKPKVDFPINNIDREWLINFDLYKMNSGVKDSTVYMYLSMIKTIYTEAQSRPSLNIKEDNPFIKIKAKKPNKRSSDLDFEDLIKIKNIKLEDIKTKSKNGPESVKRIADMLLFQFAIGGHDFVELSMLKWSNIKGKRIIFNRHKNRYKNGIESVDVMLNDFALNIIETYGDKSSDRVFTFIPDHVLDYKKYNCFLANINFYVYKTIARTAKIDKAVKSKSTRYIFRTLAGNLLINDFVIMKIQGHKPQGITFGYQGALNREIQDKEHQKILDLVF